MQTPTKASSSRRSSTRSSSRSRSRPRSRSRHRPSRHDSGSPNRASWNTAGKDGKHRPSKTKESGKSDREVTRNRASGTSRDRRANKAYKVSKGQVNVVKTASGGYLKVPYHEPARLQTQTQGKGLKGKEPASKPSNTPVHNIQDMQHQVHATYARMAGKDADKYEVRVVRSDRAEMSREDQWTVQFGVAEHIAQAAKSGQTGEHLAHGGTKLKHREMVIFCNQAAGTFYKSGISRIKGYEAYLPGEKPPGTEIYTTLPGMAAPLLPKLHEHFVAGTFGSLTQNQVQISRKAWRPAGDKESSWHVYLELDEDAIQWLKQKNWLSPIGLYVPLWGHPKVPGISGFVAPDANIRELRATLRQEEKENTSTGDKTLTQDKPDQAQLSSPQVTPQVPELNNIPMPEDERHRHVTGGSKDEEINEEEEKLLESPAHEQELAAFQDKLTPDMEIELLNTQGEHTSTPIRSRTRTDSAGSKRSNSSPEQQEESKRRTLPKITTDTSESECSVD